MDYVVRNQTKSDFIFPILETETRTKLRKKAVDGSIMDVEEEIEVQKAEREVHLPATFDAQDPGKVEVSEEELEQIREYSNFEKMVDDHWFDVDVLHADD